MLKKFVKIFFVLIFVVFLLYSLLPNPTFPKPPPDSLQSQEPADTETTLRRAYFTNFTRAQVLDLYKNEFEKSSFLGIKLPTYLLNYPPEDSQTTIHDQTMSTFLQEVVHPFRESFYINGFEPTNPKDAIFIAGRPWRQKIIIRFVPSSIYTRVGIFLSTSVLILVLFNAWREALKDKKS